MKFVNAFNLVLFLISLLLVYVSCFSILQLRRNCRNVESMKNSLERRTAASILKSRLHTEDSITNSTMILNKERDSLNSNLESSAAEKSLSALNDVKNIFDGINVFEDLHDGLEGDISELDIEYAGEESLLDISIAKAVKQMLDEGSKEPEPSPVEKFQSLYKVNYNICNHELNIVHLSSLKT